MKTLRCTGLHDLDDISKEILALFPEERIFAFYGQMGAGKTTLIKNLCSHLGVTDMVNSPTFAIVNEYHTRSGEPVYHMDFYRLKSSGELMDIGGEEYFYSGSYCLIEWPDKFEELLPDNFVYIQIIVDDTNQGRTLLVRQGVRPSEVRE
jgi:tRNA threonylcarbamoyladenosine biosynthesis protein TsaE